MSRCSNEQITKKKKTSLVLSLVWKPEWPYQHVCVSRGRRCWAEEGDAEEEVKAAICCSSLPCPMRQCFAQRTASQFCPDEVCAKRPFFSLPWGFVVSKCISLHQLTAGNATLFLHHCSPLPPIPILPYCMLSPDLAACWDPCSAWWQTLEFPFSQPLPKPFPTASFASPVHLCNLSLDITFLTLIFSSTLPWWPCLPLALAMYSVSVNKALLASQCPNIFEFSAVSLLFFSAFPTALRSAFQHPSVLPALLLPEIVWPVWPCTAFPPLEIPLLLWLAKLPSPSSTGPAPCFHKWFSQISLIRWHCYDKGNISSSVLKVYSFSSMQAKLPEAWLN